MCLDLILNSFLSWFVHVIWKFLFIGYFRACDMVFQAFVIFKPTISPNHVVIKIFFKIFIFFGLWILSCLLQACSIVGVE